MAMDVINDFVVRLFGQVDEKSFEKMGDTVDAVGEKIKTFAGIAVAALTTGAFVSAIRETATRFDELGEYFMSDVWLEKRFAFRWADMSFKGVVRNLFNEEYQEVLGTGVNPEDIYDYVKYFLPETVTLSFDPLSLFDIRYDVPAPEWL